MGASQEKRKVLMMLVENNYGVTSRISGVFSRRGFNIDSFTGCDTLDQRYSRITVVVRGDDRSLDQIEKQVSKLEDVLYITDLASCESVCRMLMLFKVKVQPEQRESLMAVTDIFHGHIVDVTRDSMIIEMTGKREKLNAFIDVLDDYEILEVSSSGMIGLERGAETARKPGVNCRLKE
ncbi:MAG: acetolactate synthase small subunit [Lachnospiraceae bacterium]|jgi:acetolactate synthase-1/3 small subunit